MHTERSGRYTRLYTPLVFTRDEGKHRFRRQNRRKWCAKPTRVKTGRLIFSSQTPHHHHRLMPLHLSNLMAQLTDSPRVTRFEIRNNHFPREEMRVWSRRRRLDSSEVRLGRSMTRPHAIILHDTLRVTRRALVLIPCEGL